MTTHTEPPTPKEIAEFSAELDALDLQEAEALAAERNLLVAEMADKVLEILLTNTNIQSAATKGDVQEIVDLAVEEIKKE